MAVAAIFQSQSQDIASTNIINKGDKSPSFEIISTNGNVKSSDLKGKVVLINFFTTWCGPCQKELAEVEKTLWPKFKDNKNFVMLIIGREHNEEQLSKYNETKKFSFPLYPDENKAVYSLFAKNYIPRSYLIDKNGKVVFQSVGFNENEFSELMGLIENLSK